MPVWPGGGAGRRGVSPLVGGGYYQLASGYFTIITTTQTSLSTNLSCTRLKYVKVNRELTDKITHECIRELTNKNKRVFKRTHVCLCVYLCCVFFLKVCSFASLGLVDIWFG